MKLKTM